MKRIDHDRCYREHLLRANLLDLGRRTELLIGRLQARSVSPGDAYARLAGLFGSIARTVESPGAHAR